MLNNVQSKSITFYRSGVGSCNVKTDAGVSIDVQCTDMLEFEM